MPMREDCRHFESRSYPGGEVARFCLLDLAPEAPWRCPADCKRYEPSLIDGTFAVGSLQRPQVEDEPEETPDNVEAILAAAEAIRTKAAADASRRDPRSGATRGRRRRPPLVAVRTAPPRRPGILRLRPPRLNRRGRFAAGGTRVTLSARGRARASTAIWHADAEDGVLARGSGAERMTALAGELPARCPEALDRRFEGLCFDWDGTAVASRHADGTEAREL